MTNDKTNQIDNNCLERKSDLLNRVKELVNVLVDFDIPLTDDSGMVMIVDDSPITQPGTYVSLDHMHNLFNSQEIEQLTKEGVVFDETSGDMVLEDYYRVDEDRLFDMIDELNYFVTEQEFEAGRG